MVLKTDKRGKLCIAKIRQDHTKNDKIITKEQLIEIEKVINAHVTRRVAQISQKPRKIYA